MSLGNRFIFEDIKPVRSRLFDDIVSSSFLWCNSRSSRKFPIDVWLKNSHLISLYFFSSALLVLLICRSKKKYIGK